MASVFHTFGLKQLIYESTRVTLDTASLIDHIADSNPENISDSAILRVTLSDHCAVHCIRKLMGSCKRQRRTITSKEMKNFDISQINSKQLVDLSDNVSTAVNNFTYLLSTFIEKHPPLRTICVSDKVTPWLTREYKKLSRSGDKRKTAAVEHKSSILISCYRQMRIKVNNLNKCNVLLLLCITLDHSHR